MKRTRCFGSLVVVLLLLAVGKCAEASPHAASVDDFRECARARIAAIRATPNREVPPGTKAYYISEKHGDDAADGRTPETAWRTSSRLNRQGSLDSGTWVLFERGGVYRGTVKACSGCTYTAYGEGPKPCICGYVKNGADPGKWVRTENPNVWAYDIGHNDVGSVVFDGGAAHAIKVLIRTEENTGRKTDQRTGRPFNSYRDLSRDLDFWHDYCENGTGILY
ncbi:MAG: hypothetical protein KBT68_00365, partial [bacterium]|nr:hypothetical protein [Candidatus Colisoma equi]